MTKKSDWEENKITSRAKFFFCFVINPFPSLTKPPLHRPFSLSNCSWEDSIKKTLIPLWLPESSQEKQPQINQKTPNHTKVLIINDKTEWKQRLVAFWVLCLYKCRHQWLFQFPSLMAASFSSSALALAVGFEVFVVFVAVTELGWQCLMREVMDQEYYLDEERKAKKSCLVLWRQKRSVC